MFEVMFILLFLVAGVFAARNELTVCIIFEGNTATEVYDYYRDAAAWDLGIEYAQDFILPQNWTIRKEVRVLPDVCSVKMPVVAHAMDLNATGVNCSVYIGPGCGVGAESLSDVAEAFDIPIMGVPAASAGLNADYSLYTHISRVSISYWMLGKILIKFAISQNWTSVAVVGDARIGFYNRLTTMARDAFANENFEIYANSMFETFNSKTLDQKEIKRLLAEASNKSRIIILFGTSKAVRSFLYCAHILGMTHGEYVFISMDLWPSHVWGSFSWRTGDRSDQVIRYAYQSLLLFTLMRTTDRDEIVFMDKVRKLSVERYNYTGYGNSSQVVPDPIAMHSFDSVFVFATAASQVINEGGLLGGRSVIRKISQKTFNSPVTGLMEFDQNSDRILDFVIRVFDNVTGKHENMYLYPGKGENKTNFGTLNWFGSGDLPPSEPRCGFRGEKLHCKQAAVVLSSGEIAAAVVAPLAFVSGAIAALYYFIKKKFFTESDPFWWRIFMHDLQLIDRKQKASSTILDRKESLAVTLDNGGIPAIANIGGVTYGLKVLSPQKRPPRNLSKEFSQIRTIQHGNLLRIAGVVLSDENLCCFLVGDLCTRGSLRNLLDDASLNLDGTFRDSLMKDLVNGMIYLHGTKLRSHGFLSDETCLIDNKFILKISDYGLPSLRNLEDLQPPTRDQEDRDWRPLLWRAPELLRVVMQPFGTPTGDVYSFAILMQQLVLGTNPYEHGLEGAHARRDTLEASQIVDIVLEVKKGSTPVLRPTIPMSACSGEMSELIENCWSEDPKQRPTFTRIKSLLNRIIGTSSSDNIVDHLIKRMEHYANGLEGQIEQKMKKFMEERHRTQELLQTLLPKKVAEALLMGKETLPEIYESTTVYFGDVDGFAEAVDRLKNPREVVALLNDLYELYDPVVAKYDVFQVEAVVDAFVIVSGLPERNGVRHVREIAAMSLEVRRRVGKMTVPVMGPKSFRLRVGINSGPCVAGLVGRKLPRFCLFGDTVNTAARMESHGEPGRIHCSESTKLLLDNFPDFITAERGETNIKGKGVMRTYWVIGQN